MASPRDKPSRYPRRVRSSTRRPSTEYTLLPGHYAVHRPVHDSPPSEDAVTTLMEDDSMIEVFRGKPDRRQRSMPGRIGPVYALQPGGRPAVPTGRVFIRFKEGTAVEGRLREIDEAGYEIADRINYAPHAAWLRARSADIADALAGIEALEEIADVENVEPQMLTQRASR